MCDKRNDYDNVAAPEKLPSVCHQEFVLPAFLAPDKRFEEAGRRLAESKEELSIAIRASSSANISYNDAASCILERSVSHPLLRLLRADKRHVEDGNSSLLEGDAEIMRDIVSQVDIIRKQKCFPAFNEKDAVMITELLGRYRHAIAEPTGWFEDEDDDLFAIREALKKDVESFALCLAGSSEDQNARRGA